MVLGAEMWIALRCISNGADGGTYPAIVDNGETHNGLGNMINGFGSDGWVSLQDVFGLAGNWMIRGFVSWPITNVISNTSFEGWHPDPAGGWQHFPNEFSRMGSDGVPYGNMFVDPSGSTNIFPYGTPSDPIRLNSFGKCCHPPAGSGCQPSKLVLDITFVIGHETKPRIIQFPASPNTS